MFCDKVSRRRFFEKKEQSGLCCDVAQSAGFVRSGAEGREQSDRNKIQRLRIRERKRRQAKGEKQKNTLKEVFFVLRLSKQAQFFEKGAKRILFFKKSSRICPSEAKGREQSERNKIQRLRIREGNVGKQKERNKKTP